MKAVRKIKEKITSIKSIGPAILLVASLVIPSVGCGPKIDPGAPIIRIFNFDGQEVNDPSLFYFTVRWRDAEGDVTTDNKPAKLIIYVSNPDNPAQKPIEIPFPVPPSAAPPGQREGTIEKISVRIIERNKNYPNRIKFTALLIDSMGRRSNKPWLILKRVR